MTPIEKDAQFKKALYELEEKQLGHFKAQGKNLNSMVMRSYNNNNKYWIDAIHADVPEAVVKEIGVLFDRIFK